MPNRISGFSDFAEELRDFASNTAEARGRVNEATDRAVERVTRDAFDESQRRVPVDTGELKESGDVYKREDGVWVIEYSADHAVIVERGSSPHLIEPRNAESLRFEVNGEVVFARRVRHPGTKGVHYLKNAVESHRADLPENILNGLEREFQEAYR